MGRDELINLCERSIVHKMKWRNRDTFDAQSQVGQLWALLKSGCDIDGYRVEGNTIWITMKVKGFRYFDEGMGLATEIFYLPTETRLANANGGDWY